MDVTPISPNSSYSVMSSKNRRSRMRKKIVLNVRRSVTQQESRNDNDYSNEKSNITINCISHEKLRLNSRNIPMVDKGAGMDKVNKLEYNEGLMNKILSFISLNRMPQRSHNKTPSPISPYSRKQFYMNDAGSFFLPHAYAKRNNPAAELMNGNILPTPPSLLERRIKRLRHYIAYNRKERSQTTCRKKTQRSRLERSALLENSSVDVSGEDSATKRKHRAEELERMVDKVIDSKLKEPKPLFMISTRNKVSINKRSFIGQLIGDVQSRMPPVLYRANRGDDTSLLPCIIAHANLNQHKLQDKSMDRAGNNNDSEIVDKSEDGSSNLRAVLRNKMGIKFKTSFKIEKIMNGQV